MILVLITTVVVYLALQYWIMLIVSASLLTGEYWMPFISTTLLWPWLRFLLNDYQHFKLG